MWTPVHDTEVNEAMDDVRRTFDRFIARGFDRDCAGAIPIGSALENVRIVITDAILAAFPRAEGPCKRHHLIRMLDANSPPDHEEALALLRRLAAEDPDEEVRLHAARIRRNLEDRAALEAEMAAIGRMNAPDPRPSPGPRRAGGGPAADVTRPGPGPFDLRIAISGWPATGAGSRPGPYDLPTEGSDDRLLYDPRDSNDPAPARLVGVTAPWPGFSPEASAGGPLADVRMLYLTSRS